MIAPQLWSCSKCLRRLACRMLLRAEDAGSWGGVVCGCERVLRAEAASRLPGRPWPTSRSPAQPSHSCTAFHFVATRATSLAPANQLLSCPRCFPLQVLREVLPEVLSSVRPELVVYNAGVDVHRCAGPQMGF